MIDAPTIIAADVVTGSFTETNLLLRRGNRDSRTTNKAVVILVEGSRNKEKKKEDGEGKDASHHPVPERTLQTQVFARAIKFFTRNFFFKSPATFFWTTRRWRYEIF